MAPRVKKVVAAPAVVTPPPVVAAAVVEKKVSKAKVEKKVSKPKAAAPPAKKKDVAEEGASSTADPKKLRRFTVSESSTGRTGGEYNSRTPEAAARKAGRQLFIHKTAGELANRDSATIKFSIRETSGTEKKVRHYTVNRTKKDKPEVITRNGYEIVYVFDYVVKPASSSTPASQEPPKKRASKKSV